MAKKTTKETTRMECGRILGVFAKHGPLSLSATAEMTGFGPERTRSRLKMLKAGGLVKVTGKTRGTKWSIKSQSVAKRVAVQTKSSGTSRDNTPQAKAAVTRCLKILALVHNMGGRTQPKDVAKKFPNMSRSAIGLNAGYLIKRGLLKRTGSTSNTSWSITPKGAAKVEATPNTAPGKLARGEARVLEALQVAGGLTLPALQEKLEILPGEASLFATRLVKKGKAEWNSFTLCLMPDLLTEDERLKFLPGGKPPKMPKTKRTAGDLPENRTKDLIRMNLQENGLIHLRTKLRGKKLRAICLPGTHPQEERNLQKHRFLDFGVDEVVMVERDADAVGLSTKHGDFFETLEAEAKENGPFAVVDMDCCNTPSYREYDSLVQAANGSGFTTSPCMIRVTTCLRAGPRSKEVQDDLAHLKKRIEEHREVLAFNQPTYVGGDGKDGAPMKIMQWILS